MTSSAARICLRLNSSDKARIVRAAKLRGMPFSAFVRDALLREVDSVLSEHLAVSLTAEESRRFLSAMDAPFQPNQKLERALAKVIQR